MSNVATAQKIEQKTNLTVVSKTDENKKEVKQLTKSTATKPEPTVEPKPVQPKVLTLDEIKRKNEILTRLITKREVIAEKLKRVENFKISHDGDTATVLITDAKGEEFESNSPKTIENLIEFWLKEFGDALKNIEEEIRANA